MVEALRTYRMAEADSDGVRCDADGLFYGGVPLLQRSADGAAWQPRSVRTIGDEFAKSYDVAFDAASRVRGLAAVARALNDGDVGLAQIATLQLRLSPLPRQRHPRPPLRKWEEAQHPRWASGSPDSVGGQFMSSNADQQAQQQASAGESAQSTPQSKVADIPQPGPIFQTANAAAHAIYSKLLPISIKKNEEYTFFYYRDNKSGLVGYTDAYPEGRIGSGHEHVLLTSRGQRLSNVTVVGMGHTHASYVDVHGMPTDQAAEDESDADHFSTDDLRYMRTNEHKFEFYTVGTPSGRVLQYIPGQGVSPLPDE